MAIYRGPGGSGDATTDAANQASVATAKAAEATTSANAAASSATSADNSATASSTSASNSATSATASENSATASASSATAAASSATAAAASYDDFDDRYLGAKSSDPTVDNDGGALTTGALYFNTTNEVIMTYTGSAWQTITTGSGGLQAANNLNDVSSATTSRTNLGLAIGSDVQAHSAVLDATTASYTTAEETKLSGIETGATADQTGAQIKTAYEAETNAFTDAQFTKLAGIETAATADQTGAQIKTAYEAETNAFTDAQFTKLAGIETAADVTDGTNVTAAGALMDSEVTNLAQVKAFSSADYATAAQGTLADSAIQTGDSPSFAGLTTTDNINFGDNDRAIFGAGSDLQIYHNGANSYIDDTGAGNLYIRASDSVRLQSATGEQGVIVTTDGAVTLYHDNGSKLATTATGIAVTGVLTTTGNVGIGTTSPAATVDVSGNARGAVVTDNDLSFDLSAGNNFSCTPTGGGTLTFTNHLAGQSGFIWLDNSGGHAIAAAGTTKINAADLTAISTAGIYTLSYFDNGTNAYVSVSRSFA